MNIVSKLTSIAGVLFCSIASADLYTGQIASLEWKTHSADAVLLVSVQSTSSDQITTNLIDVFVRDGDKTADAKSIANGWEPTLRYGFQKDWKPDGEWLLFVRRWVDKEPTVDHKVFLENPRQASFLSAVTANGQVLEDKQRILAAVKKRLASEKRMTDRQRAARRFVDKGKHPVGHQSRDRGTPEDMAPWIGGFEVPADILIWDDLDDERSFDESLWVNRITVPADEVYRMLLFDYWIDYLEKHDEEQRRITPGYPLFALVNYPGERTEQLLLRIQAVQHFDLDARAALRYLRFFESEVDLEDRRLIGSWVLKSANQQIQYDMLDNHELVAHRRPIPFPHPSKHEREWIAKGRWNLHYGRLRFLGTSLRVGSSDRFRQQSSPGQLHYQPRIIQISNDTITFDDGLELKRVHEPIDISK
jgi:hypothetical protein